MIAAKSERLSKVADEVAKCQKCQLCGGRTNVVPGQGNPDARIAFVGEAPGLHVHTDLVQLRILQ